MKSETSRLVEQIYSQSSQINRLMDSESKEEEVIARLKEELEELWRELDSKVQQSA